MILGVLKNFSLDVAKIHGQRLDNVNRTHLVRASGKLLLQKKFVAKERKRLETKEANFLKKSFGPKRSSA